ncbi:piggyBac transposable element-derived protein 3-like [Rhinatrema bivittatum]|uniref:piggyBac transposable element-derived protein 3-like n=1 Tax=Rhinatrema bivittatum TaxID=194408 RepID=UPI00112CAD0E|nr:piggyBac transposable element-derived protein 3-like [Rhinatrema bivittatum]
MEYMHKIPSAQLENLAQRHPELQDKTPFELFKLYYDNELSDMILTESVRYARQKNNMNFELEAKELDIFVGILLLSGYNSLPRELLYWNRDEDVQQSFVSSHMTGNRFMDIKKYIHLADNDKINQNDKLYKVCAFIDALNGRLQQFVVFSEHLSIDEEMIPYYGHHSAKIFIRGKLIRFGYKLWVLASSNGYPFNVDVYCGKTNCEQDGQNQSFGLGHRVVTSLLSYIENPLCHEVFFDNFFTSYDLLLALQKQNIKATGTVCENRLKQCSLIETSQMKKKERGCFDNGHVLAVKWHDNQCVIVASNYNNIEPLGKARRWSNARKCPVDLPQPVVIGLYNTHMGGVDILDRFMANYRPMFHSKKWWWPLFVKGINMAVVAAWCLHVEVGGKFDHLEFRRYIVRTLLQRSEHRTPSTSGPSSRPGSDVRFDGHNHHQRNKEDVGCARKTPI